MARDRADVKALAECGHEVRCGSGFPFGSPSNGAQIPLLGAVFGEAAECGDAGQAADGRLGAVEHLACERACPFADPADQLGGVAGGLPD